MCVGHSSHALPLPVIPSYCQVGCVACVLGDPACAALSGLTPEEESLYFQPQPLPPWPLQGGSWLACVGVRALAPFKTFLALSVSVLPSTASNGDVVGRGAGERGGQCGAEY